MQKTILISGTYPILDEKLNDLLGRSYDIAALEQPFPVNARKFGWVEAVVVYVPYCGEPEDAAAAQRYTEARAAADWATKEGLRCVLLIHAEAHSFLPCFPSACTVFILPELYGLDRRGRPEGWLGEAMRRLEAGERMDADDVVPAYFVLADEAAARIRAALRERADGTIRLIQTRRTTRFRFLGKLAALYDFDRTNIYPCDAHLPHYVPLLEEGEQYFDCSETDAGLATLYRQQYCVFRLVYLCKPDELFCGRPVAQFRWMLGTALAAALPRKVARGADCVIPVPATGICYAEGLAKGLGKPMVNALEKLHRPNNRTLCFADVERRTGLIRDHMKLTGEDLQGKQVVVVDEAIFTGTTLRIVCQMLREAGAAKVHIAIPTPMSNCRCAQYVLPAMPSLADSMPPSKMLDYFGADSLTYIPGQSFLEIARPSGAVCTDCFEA